MASFLNSVHKSKCLTRVDDNNLGDDGQQRMMIGVEELQPAGALVQFGNHSAGLSKLKTQQSPV